MPVPVSQRGTLILKKPLMTEERRLLNTMDEDSYSCLRCRQETRMTWKILMQNETADCVFIWQIFDDVASRLNILYINSKREQYE